MEYVPPISAEQKIDPHKGFSPYQKFVVAVLAFLQFTIILDFMILSPLGAILMPALKITPAQFGVVVSAYAFSAGISGLLTGGFADRYDRKKLLMFFYAGFVLGTLLCGLAPTYHFLLIGRIVTGLFGGVVGSIVFAIVTDIFAFELRGRVMGLIQTAFAASQILGLPAGMYFSTLWGWHAPFLMIVAVSIAVGFIIWFKLQPIDEHLKLQTDRTALLHLVHTITNREYILAFVAMALMSIGGFMLMPFGSAFTVHNQGIDITKLPLIYLITGIFAIFLGPIVGRASDTFGKFRVFTVGTLVTIVTVTYYTHMTISPLALVIAVNIVMFSGIFSRMIPSQALISGIPSPESRGSFMSVSASLQQMAGGLAAVISGLIVVERSDGVLEHFDTVGYILCGTAIVTLYLMYLIHKRLPEHRV